MADCFSGQCRCCECQGKHCLIPHPGHSHTTFRQDEMDFVLSELLELPVCVACGQNRVSLKGQAVAHSLALSIGRPEIYMFCDDCNAKPRDE